MRNSPVSRSEFDLIVAEIADLKRRVLLQENQHTPTVPVYLSGFPDDSVLAQVCLAPGISATCSTWTQLSPATNPSARTSFGFAFDQGRDYALLIGGVGAGDVLNTETWKWDGTTWTQLSPSTTPTSMNVGGISYPRLVWDEANQTVMLFYYTESSPHTFKTYLWDGSDWDLQSPATSPPPATAPALPENWIAGVSHAPGIGNVILFGGYGPSGNGGTQTWLWNGTTWSQPTPSTTPGIRYLPFMTYDSIRGEVVMFGGRHSGSGERFDTYTWDGTDWTLKSTSLGSGDSGNGANFAFSHNCGKGVRFAGELSGGADRTWYWDGTDWSSALPSPTPEEQFPVSSVGQLLVYDSTRRQIVLFGGWSADTDDVLGETWVWS